MIYNIFKKVYNSDDDEKFRNGSSFLCIFNAVLIFLSGYWHSCGVKEQIELAIKAEKRNEDNLAKARVECSTKTATKTAPKKVARTAAKKRNNEN